MDILTGLALFGGGAAVGGTLVAEFCSSLKRVQDRERRRAESISIQLEARTMTLRDMEKRRAQEASWCDGYEAGMREAMQNAMNGVTLGDVVTMTRLRNARRVNGTNE